MRVLTLIKYVSRYYEFILKIDGLDDFQKLHAFIHGLDKEYHAWVKTQYPKTLKDAIKNALIFDDALDKKDMVKSSKSNRPNSTCIL